MYKELIKNAKLEDLREFTCEVMEMVESTNVDIFEQLENRLYKMIYGEHFSPFILDTALGCMVNEDGTTGCHWNLEKTNSVAKQYGIEFKDYNEYDFCYVMNMMYSDYYGVVPNDVSTYVKMSKRFLEDTDGKTGKALNYYFKLVR